MRSSTMIAVLAALMVPVVIHAQAVGVIQTVEGNRIDGTFKWLSAAKAYEVTARGQNVNMQLPLEKVADMRIVEPAGLKAAIQAVQGGNAVAAIPVLEKISVDYTNLQWDRPAIQYLVEAYLKSGDVKKALSACERAIAANPEAAYKGEIAVSYWRALLKDDKITKLEDALGRAVASGDQYSSAYALMLRGDQLVAKGDTKENRQAALKDGYLRVVMLYKDVPEAQPEALYKAMKCFEAIGHSRGADKMRTALKTEFASSEWAKK